MQALQVDWRPQLGQNRWTRPVCETNRQFVAMVAAFVAKESKLSATYTRPHLVDAPKGAASIGMAVRLKPTPEYVDIFEVRRAYPRSAAARAAGSPS